MHVAPYSSGCGGIVSGIQLASITSDQLIDLRLAFSTYGVLFFRDQNLSPKQHLEFAQRYGKIVINKLAPDFSATPRFNIFHSRTINRL